MIDFEKMLEEEAQEKPINPLEIFQGSIRNEKYEYLRTVQGHVLEAWDKQRDQRDTIVKMNTGSGKTLVGLLMLQSCLNEGLGPAIYLCLNKQLVKQAVAEADACGIQTVTFESGSSIPIEFLNSEISLLGMFFPITNISLSNSVSQLIVKFSSKVVNFFSSSFVFSINSSSPLYLDKKGYSLSINTSNSFDINKAHISWYFSRFPFESSFCRVEYDTLNGPLIKGISLINFSLLLSSIA